MKKELIQKYKIQFGKEPDHLFFCPGRVNLIGEHIDYNGGSVLPCAVSMGTYLAISKNTDRRIRFHCLNFPETAEFHLKESYSKTGAEWFNYPLGIIHELINGGHLISGLDLMFYGNLPIGAGLSSSASVEVVTVFALNELFELNLSLLQQVLIAKKTENEFIGVNCGIMDQYAVAFGKKDHALLLDCNMPSHQYVPFYPEGFTLMIMNTNKERKLVDSKYNERFSECRRVLEILNELHSLNSLCELDADTFEKIQDKIGDPVLIKRAEHVIREHERVNKAAQVLADGDLVGFGQLMLKSHQSLRILYEVTGRELDTLVDFCKEFDGCAGARMTGAGFGGCAIALVKNEMLDQFRSEVTSHYFKNTGIELSVYVTEPGNGVRRVSLD